MLKANWLLGTWPLSLVPYFGFSFGKTLPLPSVHILHGKWEQDAGLISQHTPSLSSELGKGCLLLHLCWDREVPSPWSSGAARDHLATHGPRVKLTQRNRLRRGWSTLVQWPHLSPRSSHAWCRAFFPRQEQKPPSLPTLSKLIWTGCLTCATKSVLMDKVGMKKSAWEKPKVWVIHAISWGGKDTNSFQMEPRLALPAASFILCWPFQEGWPRDPKRKGRMIRHHAKSFL